MLGLIGKEFLVHISFSLNRIKDLFTIHFSTILCSGGGSWNLTIYNIIRCYNIIHWFAGTNDSSTKRLMFQVCIIFFFIIFCKILGKNRFNLFFNFFYKFTKIKMKSFEWPKSMRNYKKNNPWNIRRLVDESFVPANQRTSVLYWRLSDFWCSNTYAAEKTFEKYV